MWKRLGNFLPARDLREQGIDAAAVRLLFWQSHYRQPIDFTDEALAGATGGVKRLGLFHTRLTELAAGGASATNAAVEPLASQFERDFAAALDDDLDAPRAVGLLFDFATALNRELDPPAPAGAAPQAFGAPHPPFALPSLLP